MNTTPVTVFYGRLGAVVGVIALDGSPTARLVTWSILCGLAGTARASYERWEAAR
jgi:hypothetical protein